MVVDSTEVDEAPPAKRQKADDASAVKPVASAELEPPDFPDGYVATDGGWFAHKGGEWLANVKEKTFFHLPTGALYMDTDDGLISLTAAAETEAEAGEVPMPAAAERRRGHVRWFNERKGFGFIAPESGDSETVQDLFVHRNQLVEADGDPFFSLEKDAKVTFVLGETDNGKACAVEVRLDHGTGDGDDAVEAEDPAEERDEEAMDDGEGSCASSGSEVEIDLEAELKSGMYSVKGAVKDHCEDFAVQKVKIPVSALSEGASCIFFGVFDGHGGFTCAEYTAAHLAKNVLSRLSYGAKAATNEVALKTALFGGFAQTEHNFIQKAKKTSDGSGSTACTMTVFGPDENMRLRLFLANVGDSRAVLGRVDGKAVRLTEDHKPDMKEEKKRIELQGGSVADVHGIWRCMLPMKKRMDTGIVGLAVSRALGDKEFKNPDIISAEPELTVHEVDWDADQFVIIASDGIWDVVTDKMAVRCVQESFRNGQSEEQASEDLVKRAVGRGSKDDCTVVVVHFSWVKKGKEAPSDGQEPEEGDAEGEAGRKDNEEDDEDEVDEEEADLEAGLSIAPREPQAAAAAAEASAEDFDLFAELEADDRGEEADAGKVTEEPDDDSDDDDEYNLVGGTATLSFPSTDVPGAAGAESGREVNAEASVPGLFDNLVPTREELAVPQGPALPGIGLAGPAASAADDGLDMFGS